MLKSRDVLFLWKLHYLSGIPVTISKIFFYARTHLAAACANGNKYILGGISDPGFHICILLIHLLDPVDIEKWCDIAFQYIKDICTIKT